jgi:SAM-dependent methyltransferase
MARMNETCQLVPQEELPDRYQTSWRPAFVAQALQDCRPGTTVLDVGGGASPTLPSDQRPTGTTYIGLDPDRVNLARGDYDIRIVAGASELQPSLIGSVDLIVSWNVFEHIPQIPEALVCFHAYLKLGGILLSRFAGRWAAFAIGSRVMPHSLRVYLLSHLIGETPGEHFPTHYDRCTARQFSRMLAGWSDCEITPYYRGAGYFAFSRVLQQMYLAYECLAMRSPQLATHYDLRAVR